jgi:hypothetical protein
MTSILLAIVLGAAFGVALDRIGATNPTMIGRMLNLTNLHLMKTILLAIGTASILMFGGQMLGLVDIGHMSVKAAHIGVALGGVMLGIGWAVSGYCPGTGLAAAASGRRDAVFFAVGGLVGAAAYIATYPMWKAVGVLEGAKATLGAVPGAKYQALLPAVAGDVLGIIIGIVFVLVAWALPDRLVGTPQVVPAE